jgi:hypothetical protein
VPLPDLAPLLFPVTGPEQESSSGADDTISGTHRIHSSLSMPRTTEHEEVCSSRLHRARHSSVDREPSRD